MKSPIGRELSSGKTLDDAILAKAFGPAARVAQYAKSNFGDAAFNQVFDALGPIGSVLKAILRPKGKSLTSSLQTELKAASKLLKAFGFEVINPPSRRGGNKSKAAAAKQFLEGMGFKVVTPDELKAPGKKRITTGDPQPLPLVPKHKRRTADLDIGRGRTQRIKVDDPMLTGEMIEVTSSNVHSIGFNINWKTPSIGTMLVRFLQEGRAGGQVGGPLYEYFNVPTVLFQKFRTAASKGKWVWSNLRVRGTVSGHRYDYRLAGITSGYVPRKATVIGQEEWYIKRQFTGENRSGQQRVFTSGDDMRARYIPNRGRPEPPNRGRR